MNISIEEQIASERSFLHDISNQLVIVQGMASLALNDIKKNATTESQEVRRLDKAMGAVEKIIDLVKSRRDHIKTFQL